MSIIQRFTPIVAFSSRDSIKTEPMVWITGPRQIGKTTSLRALFDIYFNWDAPETKRLYLKDKYFFRSAGKGKSGEISKTTGRIVFDEIHKRRDWKRILKGYYDSPTRIENFIVTGSGRFDQYQRGGDSLQGRYDLFRMLPLSLDEILGLKDPNRFNTPRDWRIWEPPPFTESRIPLDSDLLELGGFPAPFVRGQKRYLRKWQDLYLDRMIREDVRDFSAVHRLDQMDLLARLLPSRVGSPLSVKALSEDIEASTVGVKSWIRLFETLYLGFLVKPFHRRIERAVKKEAKWFFYQWTYNEEIGAKFENYIAVQLQTVCTYWSDQGFGRYELFYLRDQNRREVDFVVTRDLSPLVLIEAKASEQPWTASLHFYTRKLGIPGVLVYPKGGVKQVKIDGRALGWSVPSALLLKSLLSRKT